MMVKLSILTLIGLSSLLTLSSEPWIVTKYGIPEIPSISHLACPREYEQFFLDAAQEANIPPEVLVGIASAESDFTPKALSKDGLDEGMFQLRATYHEMREAIWGAFDPYCPKEAARIAALILRENLDYFGDMNLAIAAYRQGIGGVVRNGPTLWYVKRVRKGARYEA